MAAMARSPPPAANGASMATMVTMPASTTAPQQRSVLVRGEVQSLADPLAHSNPGDSPTTAPPRSVSARAKDTTAPTGITTGNSYELRSRSRSRLGASSRNYGETGQPVTRSYTQASEKSSLDNRSRSLQRRAISPTAQALNDKVHGYLRSMSPPSPTEELAKENRSLHQRIAALQRTEADLLNENQELARRLSTAQRRHDARRQQWKEELVDREKGFKAHIKLLESQLSQRGKELGLTALTQFRECLDDAAITSWLAARANVWREWADDFAHHDPDRVHSDLHHLQLRELCKGVKHFVQLTVKGGLPEELLGPSDARIRTTHLLLQGMLANFIISETLESPFWVFDVIAINTLELESPSVPRLNSMSPVGFRMDLAMWNFSVAPPRDVRSPRPIPQPVPDGPLAEPQDTRKLPRLVTSIQPPTFSTGSAAGVLDQSLPSRQAMEGLYQVLLKVPGGNDNANAWRTSLMETFCQGGLGTEVDSILLTEDARVLAEARLRYATRLKDKFLRSAARFLLQDQDASGIEKLERRLVQEIDAALRFSCQVWCRKDTPQVKGLRDLAELPFDSASDNMELCQAQASLYAQRAGNLAEAGECPPGYHDGHSVIMVIQPSVGISTGAGTKKDTKGGSTKIWTKAKVLVASPKPVVASPEPTTATLSKPPVTPPKPPPLILAKPAAQEATAAQETLPSPDAASVKAMIGTPSPPLHSPPAPPVPPKGPPQDSTLIILPRIAFKEMMPRPLVLKQSPELSLSVALEAPKVS